MSNRHFVRVCRPRFEVAMIEVEADNDRTAIKMAEEEAKQLKAKDWRLLPFDAQVYAIHVERIRGEGDFLSEKEDLGSEEAALAEVGSLEPDEDVRYLLLQADISDGEGSVHVQPWLAELPPAVINVDLCPDWIEALEDVAKQAVEEIRGALDDDTSPSAVIPFRKRDDPDDPETK